MKIPLQKYTVVFDFDGVIWDSVNECFTVGYKAFKNMEGKIDGDEEFLAEKFRQARYLAKSGIDFYIIFRLMQENPDYDFSSISRDKFYSYREKFKHKLENFADEFYRERTRMINEEFERWMSLQGPYPGIIEQLPPIHEKFNELDICSAKDSQSIKMLLDYYNQSYDVYAREISLYKPDMLDVLSSEKNIPVENVIFVDDLMENIEAVKDIGANVMMADWGYNNREERKRAEQEGIKLLTLNEIEGQLIEFVRNIESARSVNKH